MALPKAKYRPGSRVTYTSFWGERRAAVVIQLRRDFLGYASYKIKMLSDGELRNVQEGEIEKRRK